MVSTFENKGAKERRGVPDLVEDLKRAVDSYVDLVRLRSVWEPVLAIASRADEHLRQGRDDWRTSVQSCQTMTPALRAQEIIPDDDSLKSWLMRWPKDLQPLWSSFGDTCSDVLQALDRTPDWLHGDAKEARDELAKLTKKFHDSQVASSRLQSTLINQIKALVEDITKQIGGVFQ